MCVFNLLYNTHVYYYAYILSGAECERHTGGHRVGGVRHRRAWGRAARVMYATSEMLPVIIICYKQGKKGTSNTVYVINKERKGPVIRYML